MWENDRMYRNEFEVPPFVGVVFVVDWKYFSGECA